MRSVWHGRWYAALADAFAAPLDALLRRLAEEEGVATQVVSPRTGLGAALVLSIADGLGQRRSKRETRLLAMALEGYDRRLFASPPEIDRELRFEKDLKRARSVLAQILSDERQEFEPALDRLVRDPIDLGDRPVPECVGFMRAAVAAGVVAGGVGDATHEHLDRWAVHVGLCWERLHGETFDLDAWEGGEPQAEWSTARASEAFAEIEARLDGRASQLHEAARCLVRRAAHGAEQPAPAPPRGVVRWEPHVVEVPSGRASACASIDEALSRIIETDSGVLRAATERLVHSGGKRIRPRIVLAAAEALGGSSEAALRSGAAIEWVHNASLVIDDLIDQASLRRGLQTLHSETSPQFALGVTGFVLARVQWACRSLHGDVRRAIADAALALVDGQRQELEHTANFELDRTTYYRIIENKTARLFSCAAVVGAIEADGGRSAKASARRFGHQAGLAFQIVDDLLDYDGHAVALGKRPGTDLRARKVTLPILELRDQLSGASLTRLGRAIEHGDDWCWVVDKMHEHGVNERCLERAQQHVVAARSAAAAIDGGRGALTRLLAGWLERDR